jgi:hypothetical protein
VTYEKAPGGWAVAKMNFGLALATLGGQRRGRKGAKRRWQLIVKPCRNSTKNARRITGGWHAATWTTL